MNAHGGFSDNTPSPYGPPQGQAQGQGQGQAHGQPQQGPYPGYGPGQQAPGYGPGPYGPGQPPHYGPPGGGGYGPVPPPPPPPSGGGSGNGGKIAIAAIAAVAVLAGGVFGAFQLLGGDDDKGSDKGGSARPGGVAPSASADPVDLKASPRVLTGDQLCAMVPDKLIKDIIPADPTRTGRTGSSGRQDRNASCNWVNYRADDDRKLDVTANAYGPQQSPPRGSIDRAKDRYTRDKEQRERQAASQSGSGSVKVGKITELKDLGDEAVLVPIPAPSRDETSAQVLVRAGLWVVDVRYRSTKGGQQAAEDGARAAAAAVAKELAKDKGDGKTKVKVEGACRYVDIKTVAGLVPEAGPGSAGSYSGKVPQTNCRWTTERTAAPKPGERLPTGHLRASTALFSGQLNGKFQYERKRKAAVRKASKVTDTGILDITCEQPKDLPGIGERAFVQYCLAEKQRKGTLSQNETPYLTVFSYVGDTLVELEFRGMNSGGGSEPVSFDRASADPAMAKIAKAFTAGAKKAS
ncbi:hypothetical protein [Streptomyces apocyni]|uniref:hypothetical protein n=1 Tax=Streptomyces apocyni TaxID=2654677 RepID=UPI0012EA6AF1|nr:hypothetical protein [Streptomyces apocyni]